MRSNSLRLSKRRDEHRLFGYFSKVTTAADYSKNVPCVQKFFPVMFALVRAFVLNCERTNFFGRWHEFLKIGDRVVYPMHGAGEITGVEENEVGGVKNSYFIFRLPMGDMKVMLPVDKVEEAGLREIISAEQVKDVVEVLQAETEQIQGSWNKRYHTNLERLKTGDILEAASVARNLSRQNSKRKISSGERRLLELSRQILISELVYARGTSPEETTAWVDELIDIPTQEAS